MSSQTYQIGVTKTSNTVFPQNVYRGNDTIHYYTDLETYRKLLFVLSTLGPEVHVLNYTYETISQTEVVDQFFLVLMKLRRSPPTLNYRGSLTYPSQIYTKLFVHGPASCHCNG